MLFPFGDTITINTQGVISQNSYGSDTYGTVATTVVTGAFAPAGSTELTQARDTITTQPTVYLPTGTAITAIDKVIVRGVTYDVDGEPSDWRHPLTGWQAGVAVKLQVVTG
jgi:hypothetical protein